ncbi:MAG: SDR family oxidoreductase [Eubacteriales bacterium]|jgi:short-subunit dehydrogenase
MENKEKAVALVTGASSGIGQAVAAELIREGYEVWGIGRNFREREDSGSANDKISVCLSKKEEGVRPKTEDAEKFHRQFHPVVLDLLDTDALLKFLKDFSAEQGRRLSVLVNNAGCAYYGMHETLKPSMIEEIVRTDLEVPMLITNRLLRPIRANRGSILQICSVTSLEAAPHGAAYGAAKAGLYSFSRSLLAENRKYGVRVTAILPDMTDTDLYRNADFSPDPAEGCSLSPEDVAGAVRYALTQDFIVDTVTIRPQYHRIARRNLNI